MYFFVMIPPPTGVTPEYTSFPDPTLFRSVPPLAETGDTVGSPVPSVFSVAATVRSQAGFSSGNQDDAGDPTSASASRDLTVAATLITNPVPPGRSEEHPSELQSLMRLPYAAL